MTTETRRRLWRITEGLVVVAILAVSTTVAGIWKASARHDLTDEVHTEKLTNHAGRLDTLEAPAVVVQIAQATARLEKLEEGATVSIENQAAIAGIQATQEAQTGQLERIEQSQTEQTRLIIRALQGVPPTPVVTTDPSP